jgi:hypothetical protein
MSLAPGVEVLHMPSARQLDELNHVTSRLGARA